jgi:hypothetical protein
VKEQHYAKEKQYSMVKVKRLVDTAGMLQQKASKARKDYESFRSKLADGIRFTFGEDQLVIGKKYQAILRHDHHDLIDVIEFLKNIESEELRRELLKVAITKAKELLDAEQQRLLIQEGVMDKECTLHVDPVKK